MERPVVRGAPPVATRTAAVAAPLLAAALAYGLWWLSDRAGHAGPLDRAAFGWAVVFPVWLAGPVVTGWAWRSLPGRRAAMAAATVMVAVTAVAAWLFWTAVSFPDCVPVRTPQAWVAPSLVAGALVAGGLVASGALARSLFREGRVAAAVTAGALAEAGASVAAVVIVGAALLAGPGCQRAPG